MFFLRVSIFLVMAAISGYSQKLPLPVPFDEAAGKAHLQKPAHSAPMPPLARVLHQFGECRVQVTVDPSGRVLNAITLDGPVGVRLEAADYALTLSFIPFLQNGQPILASTIVKVDYGQGSPTMPAPPFPWPDAIREAQTTCVGAGLKKTDPSIEADACLKVADFEDVHPSISTFGHFAIYEHASSALLRSGRSDEALKEADKAVEVVESMQVTDAAVSGAHLTRAQAEAVLHRLSAADADLNIAERYGRRFIATVQNEQLKKQGRTDLKQILALHAKILTAQGNAKAAQDAQAEASQL